MKKSLCILFSIICIPYIFCSPKLLIKIPTRERPKTFLSCIESYYKNLSGDHDVSFLISCDDDDTSMNNDAMRQRLSQFKNLHVYYSKRVNKIFACNRDIEKHLDFDILVMSSDDMIPKKFGYDKIIIENMERAFPDFDGVLNFHDGHIGHELNTLPIIGKKYFDRFGTIYHTGYKSLFCDLELTIVSRILNKEKVINQVVIEHQHPTYGFEKDNLFSFNESQKFQNHDIDLYFRRAAVNYDLDEKKYCSSRINTSLDIIPDLGREVVWSILIPASPKNLAKFQKLYVKLMHQIYSLSLLDQVEIAFYRNRGNYKTGQICNYLLQKARGKYISFIDEKDDIEPNYVSTIFKTLKRSKFDCMALKGTDISPKGNRYFYHTRRGSKRRAIYEVSYMNLSYLNPIKKAIASRFSFPSSSDQHFQDWIKQIIDSGAVRTEAPCRHPVYLRY